MPHVLSGGRDRHRRTVSVVVPARDEAASLALLVERVRGSLDSAGHDWEMVIVDDGSTDNSSELLAGLADDRVRPVLLAGPHGKSAALACGLAEAVGDVIVLMDADLQDLPEEMPSLLAPVLDGTLDLAQGWRTDRQDTGLKRLASTIFNGLCTAASGLRVHDVNCGYKAMTRDVARRIRLSRGLHRFLPVLAWRMGYRVGEVPVRHAHRAFGRSRYGMLRYLRGLNDLISVVLLPRILSAAAPLLAPVGLLSLMMSAGSGAILVWMLAFGRVGQLWETGLSALAFLALGMLCLALGTIERLGADLARAEQPRIWRTRPLPESSTGGRQSPAPTGAP